MGCVGRIVFCFLAVVCAAMSDDRCDDGLFVVERNSAMHRSERASCVGDMVSEGKRIQDFKRVKEHVREFYS